MHDSVARHKAIRAAIAIETGKTTKLAACNEIHPTFRAYIVLAKHSDGDELGTRYLVTINGIHAEAFEIDYYTKKFDWDIKLGDEEYGEQTETIHAE